MSADSATPDEDGFLSRIAPDQALDMLLDRDSLPFGQKED